ncbi:fibronectin type III domain-containing protein [Streptomyces sp. NPDC048484]|uniref:fibronectin type III domain-containing protein n=1 Tax=Streptomyces sp. NPDC048484 TaxID=3155146 RepID=UPI0034389E86
MLDEIRRDFQELCARGNLTERISVASSALEEASAKAGTAEPHLARLVRTRARIVRNSAIGYRAAAELSAAEERYRHAVRSLERLDSSSDELVASAEQSYLDAAVASLARGPLRELAHDLEYAKTFVSRDVHAQAEEELEELRNTVSEARRGEASLFAVREQVAVRSAQIRSRLDVRSGGLVADDRRVPPIAPGGGWAPGTFGPPRAPVVMRIVGRAASSLTVRWKNSTDVYDSQLLERSTEDGPFQVVAELGPSAGGWTTYEDLGLSADTLHRYRVRTQNEYGSNATTYNNMAVGYTRTTDDLPAWRVQFYLRVADVPDAGTGDSIQVRLQSPLFNHAPNGNRTWLDHAPRLVDTAPLQWEDDFARGSAFTYDLRSQYISQLGDITMLTLRKVGTNAIAIAEFGLVVNGREVFRKYFGETQSTCLWLDEGDGHEPIFTVYHPELRASADWQSYVQTPAFPATFFSNEEIVSRFECIVGDVIHGTPADWQKTRRPVRVRKVSVADEPFERLHVTLRLRGQADYLPDPNITLGFDLKVWIDRNADCTRATLNMVSDEVHANADFDELVDILLLAAAPVGEALLVFGMYLAREAALSQWQPVVQRLVFGTQGRCPVLEVQEDADGDASIVFSLEPA